MPDDIAYELARIGLSDGAETTVYLVRHPLADTSVSVLHFPEPQRLDHWCAEHDHPEAMIAGFFVRDPWRPLGEVRVGRRGRRARADPGALGPRARLRAQRRRRAAGRSEGAPRRPAGRPRAGRAAARIGGPVADGRRGPGGLLRRRGAVRLRHHDRQAPALRARPERDGAAGRVLRRTPLGRGRRAHARRARPADDLLRRRRGDQPGRRRLGDARAPGAPAQPPLLELESAGARVAADRHGAAVRPARGRARLA